MSRKRSAAAIRKTILLLHRDGEKNDLLAIQHFLMGGPVYDVPTAAIILGSSIRDLPPGDYRVAEFH